DAPNEALEGEAPGEKHGEPDAEHDLEGEGDAREHEGVLERLAEGLVSEDVAIVREADEGAGRPDPVVRQAEVDGHAEGEGHEGDEQHDGRHDEAVAEDVLLLPPLPETRAAAGPREPGRFQNAWSDGHASRP